MGKSAQVQLVPGVNDDVLAGAFAGLVARLTTAPFDVLKIRFQLQVHLQLTNALITCSFISFRAYSFTYSGCRECKIH